MINPVDRVIINVLLKICGLLAKYSDKIEVHEIFGISRMMDEVFGNGNQE